MEPGEEPLTVARREFEEETGHPAPVGGEIALGEIRKKSGKLVTAWAVEGDLDPATAHSNTFPMEWPPNSGQFIDVPEFDRVAWFTPDEARRRIAARRWPLDRPAARGAETRAQRRCARPPAGTALPFGRRTSAPAPRTAAASALRRWNGNRASTYRFRAPPVTRTR